MLLRHDKAVHATAVECESGAVITVVEVLCSQGRQVEGLYDLRGGGSWVGGAAKSNRETVCPRKRAEGVIERVVLLHDHKNVLDARPRPRINGPRTAVRGQRRRHRPHGFPGAGA